MGRTCRFNHGFWMMPNDFIFGSRYVKLRVTVRSISKGTTPRSLYFSLVKDYNSATSKHDDVQQGYRSNFMILSGWGVHGIFWVLFDMFRLLMSLGGIELVFDA